MKKSAIFFSILLVFAVVVFFIGLTPLRVKADEFGIVVSKTSGVDEVPVRNGEFRWHWQLLLPTNTKVKRFSIKPLNVEKTVSGELPSGAVYTALFNASGGFSYKFKYSMSLSVTPENIVKLMQEHKISDNEDLQEYLSMAADSIAQMATEFYLRKAYQNPSFRPEFVRREDITRYINLYEEFPYVDLSVFALTECVYPDYKLYKLLQNQGILVVEDFKANIKQLPPVSETETYSYDEGEAEDREAISKKEEERKQSSKKNNKNKKEE